MDFRQRRRVEPPLHQDLLHRDRERAATSVARTAPDPRSRRKRRHSGLFEAVHQLDATLDPAAKTQLAGWVRDQYQLEFGDIPMGLVSLCYLGPPFVDHRLDLIGSILDHFSPAEAMPEPFDGARMMVRTGAYEYVEVYGSGRLVPILADGSAVTS